MLLLLLATCASASLLSPQITFPSSSLKFPITETNNLIVKNSVVRVSATGKQQLWDTYSHPTFPAYSLRLKQDVQLCDPNVKQITGYLDVADTDKHFFFWFFESRDKPATDPLLLWLNGGPGCSSLTGLFMELGPCKPFPSGNGTYLNPHSWNSRANIIFLDQPVNVGFSYTEGKSPNNSDDAGKDVFAFLQLFIQTFKQYSKLPFVITGESYAGHYIPAIAKTIIESNDLIANTVDQINAENNSTLQINNDKLENNGIEKINLVSIAIGNGLTDPLVQYQHYSTMVPACDKTYGPILPQDQCDKMDSKSPTCSSLIKACYKFKTPFACVPASFYCNSVMIQPFQSTGLNIYDIRKKCDPANPLCYDILNDIESYLNREDVQDALGVDIVYEGCKRDINMNFLLAGDWMRPFVDYIPPLLESGVKVLVYAGDADYICNHFGNKAWTLELDWSGKQAFNDAKDLKWRAETGMDGGLFRMSGNLAFLRVYEAGHMVPYDQPEHSLEFINVWIHGHYHNLTN